jgi:hypothetical protein
MMWIGCSISINTALFRGLGEVILSRIHFAKNLIRELVAAVVWLQPLLASAVAARLVISLTPSPSWRQSPNSLGRIVSELGINLPLNIMYCADARGKFDTCSLTRPEKRKRVIKSTPRILRPQSLEANAGINSTRPSGHIGRHEVMKGNSKPLQRCVSPECLCPGDVVRAWGDGVCESGGVSAVRIDEDMLEAGGERIGVEECGVGR